MRETCARVLAAALMTGAIGFALAMPAIFATAHDAGRSLTAPPSFLQRSVHVVASAPSGSARGGRLEETRPIRAASLLGEERGSTPASSRRSTKAGRSERAPEADPCSPDSAYPRTSVHCATVGGLLFDPEPTNRHPRQQRQRKEKGQAAQQEQRQARRSLPATRGDDDGRACE